MSQYFTYEDLQGRVHTDVLTADPSCKTCSTSKCYNTYDNVQGVSLSKYTPFSSIRLGENDLIPLTAFPCDASMLSCSSGMLTTNPYDITVKSTSKCDPLNYKNYEVSVPKMTGSLDRNKVESSRYVRHRSLRNSSNLASDIIEPGSIRDLSLENVGIDLGLGLSEDVYSVSPFDYKTEVVVPKVKTSLSVVPRPMSPSADANKNARSISRNLSEISKPSVSVVSKPVVSKPVAKPVAAVVAAASKPVAKPVVASKSSTVSSISSSVSSSVSAKPTVGSNIKSNRVPLVLPVSPKKK